MTSKKETIHHLAKQILQQHPGGLRYAALGALLKERLPDISVHTIHGNVLYLDQKYPEEITKPERGLFKWIGGGVSVPEPNVGSTPRILENAFYEPFADYLVRELEECTEAVPIGGSMFREKWGTPDVMGILKARDSDIIKFPTQVVSAEIKTDTSNDQLITAFGQACAYKLFSHKSYLVLPKDSGEGDLARMESLCFLHGIGLVLFNKGDTASPCFEIRHRAAPHEPDPFYVNEYARTLAKKGILFN